MKSEGYPADVLGIGWLYLYHTNIKHRWGDCPLRCIRY